MTDIPLMYAEGETLAYADTFYQLAEEAAALVDDPSLKPGEYVRLMNRGLGEIVAKLAATNVFLPSLATEGEVTARADRLECRLPANYHGNLESVIDLTVGKPLCIISWDRMREMRNHNLPGRLHTASVSGGRLYYWHAPDNDHRLKLSYHRYPVPLLEQDRITALPPELSPAILVNYAAMRGFERIEQDPGDGKVQTKYHATLFNDALMTLIQEIGPWPTRPVEPSDYMHWSETW